MPKEAQTLIATMPNTARLAEGLQVLADKIMAAGFLLMLGSVTLAWLGFWVWLTGLFFGFW